MNHLFRDCPTTNEVWRALSFQNIIMNQCEDFVQWITWVLEKLNLYHSRLFCCALWAIWGDRNKRVHEGKVSTGKEVANFINSYMGEITSLERRDLNFTRGKIRWKRPQGGFIKINFDGAFNKSQNRSASGVVVRDSEGKILLSCTEIHENILSAFAAEAIACRKAGQDRSMIGTYIYDIQQQIYGLDKIRFQHAPRSANSLTHILTTETLRRGEEVYLDMGVPEYAEEQGRYKMRREPD
ncbi:hypothetical protein GOBAR_DD18535 [Gossypium barbadense]|nr:hypothetical protein GOBAR_DD18535 [Gossypium barbadense]